GCGQGFVDIERLEIGGRVRGADLVGIGADLTVAGGDFEGVVAGGFVDEEEAELGGFGRLGLLGLGGGDEKAEAGGQKMEERSDGGTEGGIGGGRRGGTNRRRRSATGEEGEEETNETTGSLRYGGRGGEVVHISLGESQRKETTTKRRPKVSAAEPAAGVSVAGVESM